MREPDGVESRTQRFPCGHDNPARNRFCDECGAPAQRKCPLCESLIREDAKFCGACGVRLDSGAPEIEPAAPSALVDSPDHRIETSARPRPWAVPEADDPSAAGEDIPWAPRGGWRRDGLSALPDDDLEEEDSDARRARRRVPLLLLGALALIALVAGLLVASQFDQAGPAGPIRQLLSKLGGEAAPAGQAEQPPAPEAEQGREPDGAVTAPASPSTAAQDPPSSPEPSPPPQEAPPPPATARAEPAPPPAPAPEPGRLPTRSLAPAIRDSGESDAEAARAGDTTPPASEERVAQFLIGQFGRTLAEEKARSNAAWYGPGHSENTYWSKVADAIARHPGN